jgi:hypothetical protein
MKTQLMTAALLLMIVAPSVQAQAPAPPPRRATAPTLVFEREVYDYQAAGRRDPFRPLTSNDQSGPLFSELTLTGTIIDVSNTANSIAMFRDLNKKQYRLRRGDRIGNATIQYIDKTRVVFSIEEFGMKRQEVLNLTKAGA